jgi:chaperone BCS1
VFKHRTIERHNTSYLLSAIHKTTLQSLIESVSENKDHLTEIRYSTDFSWVSHKQLSRKPESIVGTPIRDIIKDAFVFTKSRDRYNNLGVPYRRGYLFSGPPGTGKSSCALCLAGELNSPLCFLSLSGKKSSDEWLIDSFSRLTDRSIVLFDDFDRVNLGEGGITMSGILNVLDGAIGQTGKIIVMVANDISKIQAVMLRPGRIDRRFEFRLLNKVDATEMYKRFHGDNFADVFAKKYAKEHSAACVMSHCMRFGPEETAVVTIE